MMQALVGFGTNGVEIPSDRTASVLLPDVACIVGVLGGVLFVSGW